MVKAKVKVKDNDKKPSSNEDKDYIQIDESKANNTNNTLLFVLGILMIIIIVLQIVDLQNSTSGSVTGGMSNSELKDIQEKVTRLDTFFINNIPEYTDTQAAQLDPNDFPRVNPPNTENRPMMGDSNAQITLVEYSDFECPFCARFHQTTYPTLKQFVDQGVASFVYKDFPLSFHSLAEPAAVASKCVFRDLGDEAFFKYHDTIFENQQSLSNENLKVWAIELGMDESSYDSCIENSDIKAQVQADFLEGQSLGVSGTPSVVLNDKLIVGACPAQTFEQAIALELEGTPFYVEECNVITA